MTTTTVTSNDISCEIRESDEIKVLKSPVYNYFFNKKTGLFLRWGKTKDEDPEYSPFGPEILDIEISTICNGVPNARGIETPCSFCYKSNTRNGMNMSLDTFKAIMDKFPKSLTQIAIGADAGAKSNPDTFKMMEYTRSLGVIPNMTVSNIDDEAADNLAHYCGAVAVSRYEVADLCYNSVKKLTDRGMNQVNIHAMVSKSSIERCRQTIIDRVFDKRLEKLNAIVFLSLKQHGRGVKHDRVSYEEFAELVELAFKHNVGIGFDTCSSSKFMTAIKDHPSKDQMEQMVEPCEAMLFSFYIGSDATFHPCSFCENEKVETVAGFPQGKGINILECDDFIKDVWNHPQTLEWRKDILEHRRKGDIRCTVFEI